MKKKLGIIDPLDENKFTVHTCLVHKYENRVLLELTNKCLKKCEFCSRKWKLERMDSIFFYEMCFKIHWYF